jgi:predicted N-formylglutamate amidohydrolase
MTDSTYSRAPDALLADGEPAPYELIERPAGRRIVVVCDHAGNRVPRALGTLGLEPAQLNDHIAIDLGAADVARLLAARFEASAVLGVYSRLVVDLNRDLDDATAFPPISDGVRIPGNADLDRSAKSRRARALFKPYHEAVAAAIRARTEGSLVPVFISVHSFTPRMNGLERPWHVGILWDKDPRLALPLLAALRAERGLVVGDNEPYSGRHPADFTVDHHAEAAGIAHVGIELRQDLLQDEDGRVAWAERLGDALQPLLDDEALFTARVPQGAGADR